MDDRYKKKASLLAFILITLGQAAIDIYVPSLPAMQQYFHTTADLIQLSIAIFLIGYASSQLIYGPLSDRWGRRPILLFGLGLSILGYIACMLAENIYFLLFTRLIQGLGIGAANLLARGILRDLFEGKELAKKTSHLAIAWVCVPIIAPVLGGYIQDFFGWRMNFALLALVTFVMWMMILLVYKETKDPRHIQPLHLRVICRNYFTLLSHGPLMGANLAVFFMYGIFVAFYAVSPFLLQNVLGISTVAFGWMMLFMLISYGIGSFIAGRLVHYWPQTKIIWAGLAGSLIVSVVLLYLSIFSQMTLLSFIFPVFLLFLFIGLVYPNCVALSMHFFPALSGSASALFGFLSFLGGTIAGIAIALFPETVFWPFSLLTILECAGALLILWGLSLRRTTR